MRTAGATPALLGALVAVMAACAGGGRDADPERARRGREVYGFEGCASCHGRDREGSRSAPPLAGVRRHWTAAELERYLRHPAAYPADARLRRLADRYPAGMAGLPAADRERLRDLVAFLLQR